MPASGPAASSGMEPTLIERAFSRLEAEFDILAVHNAACCSNCAHLRLSTQLELRPELAGFCYWHDGDLDAVLSDSRLLFVGFSAAEHETYANIAQTALDVIREAGLEATWSGDVEDCIEVTIPQEDLHFFERYYDQDSAAAEEAVAAAAEAAQRPQLTALRVAQAGLARAAAGAQEQPAAKRARVLYLEQPYASEAFDIA